MPRRHWVAYVAALGIALLSPVASQPARDRAAVAIEHHDNADGGYSAANPLLPPVVLAPIKIQAAAFQSAADEQPQSHGDNGAVRWTDVAIVGLTLVLALCGIAGAGIAYYQWKALKDQVAKLGEAIQAETDAGSARASENAAALAAAHQANEIAREGSARELRAYVHAVQAAYVSNFPEVTVSIKNFGQTPAHKMGVWVYAEICGKAERPKFVRPDKEPFKYRGSIAPTFDFQIKRKIEDKDRHVEQIVYAFGEATYEDVFGKVQTTQFCFTAPWPGSGQMEAYKSFNTAT